MLLDNTSDHQNFVLKLKHAHICVRYVINANLATVLERGEMLRRGRTYVSQFLIDPNTWHVLLAKISDVDGFSYIFCHTIKQK